MTFNQAIPLIVAFLGSGGLLGAVYALLKLRPEAGQIVVTAAQGALVVQTGVIESLRADLAATREDLATTRAANEGLRERVADLAEEVRQLRTEIRKLTERNTS